ncbi:MAG: ATP-binding cassette domain-containing protein [Planctomycetaceae bacterium]|jgi:sodium transport system ATP-binding protein|nr:ATP-binding cassette domain-containing protein [Planctomycetaceae bacterium]MDG2390500.1 ATP-binding cassette domain-containing protein [Planctomycetaceae bacterium]
MIDVAGLTKTFSDVRRGEVEALKNVSFTAKAGEIFGLLGPNGAGKTTCLRLLSTVLRPTAGRAEIAGFDVVKNPEQVRAHIGFMSGNTGVYDRMSAWEMVEYFGRLYGVEESVRATRQEEIFGTLQMDDFRDILGSKMSTGMKQKVSIARTLIHDPPVLIFDEPTSGLDVLVARSVIDAIERLREQGKCVIFSTHIMREVERLCDEVAVIDQGEILAAGTLDELREQYQQPDVEELFYQLIADNRANTASAKSGENSP